jgi:hypothetical protein
MTRSSKVILFLALGWKWCWIRCSKSCLLLKMVRKRFKRTSQCQ